MNFVKSFQKISKSFHKNPLFWILLISLITRIIYLLLNYNLWWDSHVYIGMGKYIFTQGKLGLWESFRPLTYPILLGTFWKLNLPVILTAKLVNLIFSLASITLIYHITKKLFNKTSAILSALLFSFTPVFFMFTGLVLSEPLAILFILLAIYFFISQTKKSALNLFLSGIFTSLAFLTKFPLGIILLSTYIILIFNNTKFLQKIKHLFILTMGFLIPTLPYLIFNYFTYPNPLEPFLSGNWIVSTATWLYGTGILFYLTNFFLKNPPYLVYFYGLYDFIKKRSWKNSSIFLIYLIPTLLILYFTFFVARKEIRYLVFAVPFLAIIVSPYIIQIYQKLKKSKKPFIKSTAFIFIVVILIIIGLPYLFNMEKNPDLNPQFVEYIQDHNIQGPILTTSPSLISYLDNSIIPLSGMDYALPIYQNKKSTAELIIINACELICHPQDQTCLDKKQQFLQLLKQENIILLKETLQERHHQQILECTYFILKPKS
jgi:4-amino-4-deoxy-L-arabinose transferase-like glycosyltransferase